MVMKSSAAWLVTGSDGSTYHQYLVKRVGQKDMYLRIKLSKPRDTHHKNIPVKHLISS